MKKTKRIAILGAGESGTGAALLANWLGYDVVVSDKSPIKPQFKAALDARGIAWEEGQHSMDKILAAGEIIKSPGIPEKADVMQAIRAKDIPVIGEIEFGWRHRPKGCRVVAITGSNGKTTTTTLTAHLLAAAGLPARMAGNVGNSFAQLVLDDLQHDTQSGGTTPRIYVLEVSSFQLDDIDQFRANIAVLLNITPDHLDRYDYQLENYTRSKFRINRNQKRGDIFLFNGFDPVIREYMDRNTLAPAKKVAIRRGFYKNGVIRVGRKYAFEMAQSKLQGPHNMFNAACALRVALLLGADPKRLQDGLLTYSPPAHRLEPIAILQGVTWINDSKATNVDSVFYALQAMEQPTVWIVGGQDKGNEYSPLMALVRKKVKAIVCMGVDNSKIIAAFKKLKKPLFETRGAQEAVQTAARLANPGDTVLLSPACASFDLFKNYEDRGDQFRTAVLALK